MWAWGSARCTRLRWTTCLADRTLFLALWFRPKTTEQMKLLAAKFRLLIWQVPSVSRSRILTLTKIDLRNRMRLIFRLRVLEASFMSYPMEMSQRITSGTGTTSWRTWWRTLWAETQRHWCLLISLRLTSTPRSPCSVFNSEQESKWFKTTPPKT